MVFDVNVNVFEVRIRLFYENNNLKDAIILYIL